MGCKTPLFFVSKGGGKCVMGRSESVGSRLEIQMMWKCETYRVSSPSKNIYFLISGNQAVGQFIATRFMLIAEV